ELPEDLYVWMLVGSVRGGGDEAEAAGAAARVTVAAIQVLDGLRRGGDDLVVVGRGVAVLVHAQHHELVELAVGEPGDARRAAAGAERDAVRAHELLVEKVEGRRQAAGGDAAVADAAVVGPAVAGGGGLGPGRAAGDALG